MAAPHRRRRRPDPRTMANPFVYGEIVPPASFVDRETELDRLTADLLAGQKIFLISPRRYGKSSLVRRRSRRRRQGRRADRRGHGQQLQFLRRLPRGLCARAVVGRDAHRPGARVAARHARRRQARGARRIRRARRQPARPLLPVDQDRQGRVAAGAGGLRAARTHRRGAASQAGRRARRIPGDRHRSTAATSSMRCAPPFSSSARSATCSPDPSRA